MRKSKEGAGDSGPAKKKASAKRASRKTSAGSAVDRDDAVLGRLKWDGDLESWASTWPFEQDEPTELFLSGTEGATGDFFRGAAKTARRITRTLPAIKRFAADALLDLKNDAWLGDGEKPIDMHGFVSRIFVASVGVRDDGANIYFHDGDLFRGHSIIVQLDQSMTPIDADIAG